MDSGRWGGAKGTPGGPPQVAPSLGDQPPGPVSTQSEGGKGKSKGKGVA